MTSSTLPLIVALPFAGVLALAAVPNARRNLGAGVAGLVTALALAVLLWHTPAVLEGEIPGWRVNWLPQLGLFLGARLDGLAWMFSGLVLVIGLLVILYAAYYLSKQDPQVRFFQFLLAFMGSMLGLVLADNLIAIAIFWEFTSLSSFLLIGYWSHRADARFGARQALTITGAGGLALLGGMLLIGHIVGSYDLDVVLASGHLITAHELYPVALGLVLLGAFTKSAQFPFHFWLPHAMAAPTPVSAYLHSATMVKAGVFLLARMHPALAGTEAWFWIVSSTGLATLLVGAYLAVFQHDLKGLLAYSTISHLGLITLLLGLDEPLAVVAAVFHIINHATFKASLFMAAGIIDHECGTRDMRKLGRLARALPYTAVLAIVATAAMAGVPLMNGFLSKEMFFAETITLEGHLAMEIALPVGATLAGLLSVAYSTRFIHDVFFGKPAVDLPRVPHEPPRFMRVPVELLVLVCLAVGLAPNLTIATPLAAAAAAALGGPLPEYQLALWHGFNLPLLMSAIALAGGLALYFGLQRFVDLHGLVHFPRGGREAFGRALAKGIDGARRLTLALESGRLQRYLAIAVVVAVTATALPMLNSDAQIFQAVNLTPLNPLAVVVWFIGVGAAIATAIAHRQRLLAVVLVGAVGLTVSLAFVYLSAPDLALTQLLVELVTVVLLMLALRWLPQLGPREIKFGMQRGAIFIATVAGAGVAALTWAMLTRPGESIAEYFLETAKTLGGGTNVVNVILVDYRGFDTLGEVTVLGVAGIIVAALLTGLKPARPQNAPATPARDEVMLSTVMGALLPFAIAVSLYLFLRGHDLPGGGFIAGLVLAVGLVCQHVASNDDARTAAAIRVYRVVVGAGLLVALATGVASWLFGFPFLTSSYVYWPFPIVGEVPLASALLFDLGIYLGVVGATMLALLSLARLGRATEVR